MSADDERPLTGTARPTTGSTIRPSTGRVDGEAAESPWSTATLLLHAAARSGDTDRAQAALEAGAEVNLHDTWGLCALHSAALAGHANVAKLLLAQRADADIASARGQTALHLAATENRDGVVQVLVDGGADVALLSAYGNTALDLAMRHGAGNPSEQRIRAEFTIRWHRAHAESEDFRRQLDHSERMMRAMELQLGGAPDARSGAAVAGAATGSSSQPGGSRPSVAGGREDRSGPQGSSSTGGKKLSYWASFGLTIAEMRSGCEAVSSRTWVRELPSSDPFPAKGPLVVTGGNVLPENDPEDPDLVASFQRLQAVVVANRRREERWATHRARAAAKGEVLEEPDDDVGKMAFESAVLESTGHTQQEWEQLVDRLLSPDANWDWSKIEVHERKREEDKGASPGVWAVGQSSKKNEDRSPVFQRHDIIGPLGGVLRRRARFEQLHYRGRKWVVHDPQAYEVKLRARTTELAIEPLVLDLTWGASQNRLWHLADARNDPLGLRELLGYIVPTRPGTAEALGLTRTTMRRPRSRPHSPLGGAQLPPSEQTADAGVGTKSFKTGVPAGTNNEAEAAAEAANVLLAEVLVHGWPYVFAVATKPIFSGEELMVDHGVKHWEASRFVLSRLRDVSQLGRDLLLGTKTHDDIKIVEEEPPVSFPKREPMRRAESKEAARRREVPEDEV